MEVSNWKARKVKIKKSVSSKSEKIEEIQRRI